MIFAFGAEPFQLFWNIDLLAVDDRVYAFDTNWFAVIYADGAFNHLEHHPWNHYITEKK